MGRDWFNRQLPPIQPQEGVCEEERDPLVSVNKSMVQQQGLKQRRSHFRDVAVISGLRSIQSAFKQAQVADSRASTKPFDQSFVNGNRFVNR